jgi:hypothetical protein
MLSHVAIGCWPQSSHKYLSMGLPGTQHLVSSEQVEKVRGWVVE